MRLFSFITGERGYCAIAVPDEGPARAILATEEGALSGTASGDAEEGRVRFKTDGDGRDLEMAWSPAGQAVEFGMGESIVAAHGIAATGKAGDENLAGPGVAWELPASGYSAIRTVWAIDAKSSLLLLVSLRPEDSREHGEELVGAGRIVPKAEPYGYIEPLLSTEYDAAGNHERATLELWQGEDDRIAERGAGRRIAGGKAEVGGERLSVGRFAWSIGGKAAVGGYEILTP